MTHQPLEFAAPPRPYRLGNDQLRRYNRVRSGQKKQGRINIAIDVVTVLLIISVSAIVAVVEMSSMPEATIETLAAVALALILGGGLILLALLAVGAIALATESALQAALVSLPLAMGLVNSWRSCQALRRITARTL